MATRWPVVSFFVLADDGHYGPLALGYGVPCGGFAFGEDDLLVMAVERTANEFNCHADHGPDLFLRCATAKPATLLLN